MIPDEALYHLIKQGQMQAFDLLYARYEGPLYGYILRIIGAPADAEEIFHEAFLRVLDTPEVSFAQGNFRSWIYRIARNVSLNRLKGQQRRSLRDLTYQKEPLPTKPGAEELLTKQQVLALLHQAMTRLPERLNEVLQLRIAGMAYDEIAHILEIPTGTVKSRLHETIKRLQQELLP